MLNIDKQKQITTTVVDDDDDNKVKRVFVFIVDVQKINNITPTTLMTASIEMNAGLARHIYQVDLIQDYL